MSALSAVILRCKRCLQLTVSRRCSTHWAMKRKKASPLATCIRPRLRYFGLWRCLRSGPLYEWMNMGSNERMNEGIICGINCWANELSIARKNEGIKMKELTNEEMREWCKEWTNEWTRERLNERRNKEWANEQTNERLSKRMNERVNARMNKRMNERTNPRTTSKRVNDGRFARTDERLNQQMNYGITKLENERTNEPTYEQMNHLTNEQNKRLSQRINNRIA